MINMLNELEKKVYSIHEQMGNLNRDRSFERQPGLLQIKKKIQKT